jgi:hypothetical protein
MAALLRLIINIRSHNARQLIMAGRQPRLQPLSGRFATSATLKTDK